MPTVEIIPSIEQMIIQLISLIVLLFVFKRYGWGPTKKFIEKRKEILASQFDEAQRAKEESLELKRQYEEQISQANDEAHHIIESSKEQGKKEYEEIISDARKEASQKIARASEAIEQDVKNAQEKIKEDIIEIAISGAEQLIKKEIDAKAHQKLFDDFVSTIGAKNV